MVYGKGINDMERGWKTKNELNERIYQCWKNIIMRCYCKNFHITHPTYKDCYVCDKWLKLSGFIEDLPKIPNYNKWINGFREKRNPYDLDKDIKSNGTNKCYCLEQCMFVLRKENITQSNATRDTSFMNTEEYKNKMRNATKGKNKGRKLSDDWKNKISESNKNKKHTEETKQKLRELNKGAKNKTCRKVAQYDLDGNLIKIWDYIKQISEELPEINYSSLKSVLQGKTKTNKYRNFIWKYYNDNCNKSNENE